MSNPFEPHDGKFPPFHVSSAALSSASVMRTCSACKKSLPVDDFGFKNTQTGARQSRCKACMRAYAKDHYKNKKGTYLEKAKRNNLQYRERNKQLVELSLTGCRCSVCGEMEKLHFCRGEDQTHEQSVHMAVHHGLSEYAVRQAISRSVVLCEDCMNKRFVKTGEKWRTSDAKGRKVMQAEKLRQGPRKRANQYIQRTAPQKG